MVREETITEKRSYNVVKSNDLIRKAKTELSVQEAKIMAFIFSKIKPTDESFEVYCFSIKEYMEVAGISSAGSAYDTIKKQIENIHNKSFWIMQPDGTEELVSWIDKAWMRKSSGKVRIRLDETIQKYVVGLTQNFTQYSLLCILPMKSAYSIRLFELLESYLYKKSYEIEIEELKEYLCAAHYKNFKDFKKRVPQPAIIEINTYGNISVNWQPRKSGNKIIGIIFDIRQKTTKEMLFTWDKATEQIDGQMNIADFIQVKE